MKNKKLLTTLACGAFALVGGLTLVGCGGPKTETLDQKAFTDYVQAHGLAFKNGYKGKTVDAGATMEINSKKINNVVEGFLKVTDSSNTLRMAFYVTGGKVYTYPTKTFVSAENDETDQLQLLDLGYSTEGLLSALDEFIVDKTENPNAEDVASFTKTTDGKKVIWEIKPKAPSENEYPTFKIEYDDGQLQKFGAGADNEFTAFNGELEFPDDLNTYTDAEAPALTLASDISTKLSESKTYMVETLYKAMKDSEVFEDGGIYTAKQITDEQEFDYYVHLADVKNVKGDIQSITLGKTQFAKDQEAKVSLGYNRHLRDRVWYMDGEKLMVAAPIALLELGTDQTLKVGDELEETVTITPFATAKEIASANAQAQTTNTVTDKNQEGYWTLNVKSTTAYFEFDVEAQGPQQVIAKSVTTYKDGTKVVAYCTTDLTKDNKFGVYATAYNKQLVDVYEKWDGAKVEYTINVGDNQVYTTKYQVSIDATEVENEQGLTAAIQNGGVIKLKENIDLTDRLNIAKDTLIDLNGHNITDQSIPDGKGAIIWVQKGTLTIVGEGEITSTKLYVFDVGSVGTEDRVGNLVIKSGTFEGLISVVQVERGKAEIYGGTFKLGENAKYGTTYMLNLHNTTKVSDDAKIEVYGGTFEGFDPAHLVEEKDIESFVVDGYVSTGDDDVYTVTKTQQL